MQEAFQRTALVLGEDALERLEKAHICVVGLGGVGSYVAEALARSGVGQLTLVDDDTVNLTNCNRQLCALHSTVGRPKAEVVAARVRDINPECRVNPLNLRYTGTELDLSAFDYVADAIDSLADKLMLIENAAKSRTFFPAWARVISWMPHSYGRRILKKPAAVRWQNGSEWHCGSVGSPICR